MEVNLREEEDVRAGVASAPKGADPDPKRGTNRVPEVPITWGSVLDFVETCPIVDLMYWVQ
jgi:hypothetical protein